MNTYEIERLKKIIKERENAIENKTIVIDALKSKRYEFKEQECSESLEDEFTNQIYSCESEIEYLENSIEKTQEKLNKLEKGE